MGSGVLNWRKSARLSAKINFISEIFTASHYEIDKIATGKIPNQKNRNKRKFTQQPGKREKRAGVNRLPFSHQ